MAFAVRLWYEERPASFRVTKKSTRRYSVQVKCVFFCVFFLLFAEENTHWRPFGYRMAAKKKKKKNKKMEKGERDKGRSGPVQVDVPELST